MPKAKCILGFESSMTEKDPINHPGVWTASITERTYFADIVKNARSLQASSEQVNDHISLTNRFSIIADPYARSNFTSILYLDYLGTKWKVTNVEVDYPRLLLTLGGVYNAH